jgi:hypothetical protein
LTTREWVDCDDPPIAARQEAISRRYTSLSHTACGWTVPINLRVLTEPVTLYRAGVDVTCTLEEWERDAAAPVDRDAVVLRLYRQGIKAAFVDEDKTETIANESFRYQVISANLAAPKATPKQRQRNTPGSGPVDRARPC